MTKDILTTKVAKDTKIGQWRGPRILKKFFPFVSFVRFVVISIFLLVAVRRYFSSYSLSASKRGSSPRPGVSVRVTQSFFGAGGFW